MNAYQRAKKKYRQLEYQLTKETGKCVVEYRRDYLEWLDAKGEDTFGLLDPYTKPLHQHIKEDDERLRETIRQTAARLRVISAS